MIEHIYKESELLYKETIHRDDWWFWHDALSLMTAKETVAWMKEKGYYHHWLLPELDLYRDYADDAPQDSDATNVEILLTDLDDLKKAGVTHKDINKVKAALQKQ